MPSVDVPRMPTDMDAEAKAVWRRVLREMRHTGVIRAADADVLRCYCEAVSRYAQVARLYVQSGPTVRRDGEPVKNPLHQLLATTPTRFRKFARGLGLSPSARVGLRIEPGRELDAIIADIGLPPRLRMVANDA